MAEKKGKKEAAGEETTEKSETPQERIKKERIKKEKAKSAWTLERCLKAARRFDDRTAWAKGAPSSYKAAVAHGWDTQCSAHMQATPLKSAKVTTKTPAKKKTPARLPKSA